MEETKKKRSQIASKNKMFSLKLIRSHHLWHLILISSKLPFFTWTDAKKNYRMILFFCLCGVHQKLMDWYWKISGNDLKHPFLFSWTVCSICIINSWKRCTIIIIIPHVFIHHTSKIWDFGLWPTRNWKLTIDSEDTWRHAHKRNYHDWAKTLIPDSWVRHPTMAATWFGWILRVRKLHVILDGN